MIHLHRKFCVIHLQRKLHVVIFVILLFNELKILELIQISNLLLFKCFDFASGEITIIWHADVKRATVLFCSFKIIQS